MHTFAFDEIDTLKVDPAMPYHDLRQHFVNLWFSLADRSDGPDLGAGAGAAEASSAADVQPAAAGLDRVEVLLLDGQSTDGTQEIARRSSRPTPPSRSR